jgi:hypothetical protein
LQVPVASATTAAVAAAAPGVSVVERTRGRARGFRLRSEGADTSSVATAAADPVGDIRSWLDAVDDDAACACNTVRPASSTLRSRVVPLSRRAM